MAAKRTRNRHTDDDPASQRMKNAFFAAWESEVAGGKRIAELAFGQDSPQQNVEDAVKKARYWFQYNWMVGTITLLRLAFFNYGLKVKAVDKADGAKLEAWAKKREVKNEIKRYARDAWLEFLITDNVVGLWRLGGKKPLVFNAEDCEFKDKFGHEVLTINTELTPSQVEKIPGMTPAEVKQLCKKPGKLELTHANPAFFFDVVRREKIGNGFAWPGLARIFVPAAQNEGMEVGDNLLGQTDRIVYEQHLMGHETRYGQMAGTKVNFITETKAKAVKKDLTGKVGLIKLATNFDHKILIGAGRVDPKFYDGKKYEGVIKKFSVWAAPLAQMFLERNLNPNLMDLLKQQAALDREYLEPHLAKVFKDALGAPVEIEVSWSNRCFKDARLAADLLKFGLQWGYLSQQTAQTESGYDPEQEYQNKAEEAKKPEAETNPLVDANHGKDKEPAGKKRGTADGSRT